MSEAPYNARKGAEHDAAEIAYASRVSERGQDLTCRIVPLNPYVCNGQFRIVFLVGFRQFGHKDPCLRPSHKPPTSSEKFDAVNYDLHMLANF